MSGNDFPDWVWERLRSLANEIQPGNFEKRDDINERFPSWIIAARYIVAHEVEPVDPLVEIIRQGGAFGNPDRVAESIHRGLAERGLKIVEAA